MVTLVGLETDFKEVVVDLIRLDFDAVEAYEEAIVRLSDESLRGPMREFMQDHIRHTRQLAPLAQRLGEEPPREAGAKSLLTQGKVVLADLFGDRAILMAMKTNEEDTNTAYERALNHEDLPSEARDLIRRNLEDERRHRAWIIDAIDKL